MFNPQRVDFELIEGLLELDLLANQPRVLLYQDYPHLFQVNRLVQLLGLDIRSPDWSPFAFGVCRRDKNPALGAKIARMIAGMRLGLGPMIHVEMQQDGPGQLPPVRDQVPPLRDPVRDLLEADCAPSNLLLTDEVGRVEQEDIQGVLSRVCELVAGLPERGLARDLGLGRFPGLIGVDKFDERLD